MRSVLVFTACLMVAALVSPANGQVDEQSARAAAVVNVAKFVQWPAGWSSGPFQIAVAADEDFASVFTAVTRNAKLHDREIRVRRLGDAEEECRCHLLFVSAPADRRAALLLRWARTNHVLTIGETTAFLREGGIVRLFREDDRLRLQISAKSAEGSGLQISSRLLRIAVRSQ